MTLDDLSALFMAPWAWLLCWLIASLSPLVGWGLATVLCGTSGRGARAVGSAAGLMVAGLILARPLLAAMGLGGGALAWVSLLGTPTGGWLPRAVVAMLGALLCGVFVVLCGLTGLVESRRAPPEPIPDGRRVRWLLVFGSALLAALAYRPYGSVGQGRALLELVATAPLVLSALAIWTQARGAAQTAAEPQEKVAPAPASVSPVSAIWGRLGAAGTRPIAERAATESVGDDAVAGQIWTASGGAGAAPGALRALVGGLLPGKAWLIPDLPEPTESTVITAATLIGLQQGLRVLVLTESPDAVRDALLAVKPSGSVVVGAVALRAALAAGSLPAVIILDVAALSEEAIRLMGEPEGAVLAARLGLILLPRLDRGEPLAVTHRLFTLRRLSLALRAALARPAVLATGFGGPASRVLLDLAFPGFEVAELPLEPRSRRAVEVFLAATRFRAAPGLPWVRRALEPLEGRALAVSDPGGTLDRRDLGPMAERVSLSRDLSLSGDASAAMLDEAWLVGAWRALDNRVALIRDGAGPHTALWGIADDPMTRFLLRDDNLRMLHRGNRLLPPRPLVGADNPALGRAHLDAALREGEPDLPTLITLFGARLVGDSQPLRHALRPGPRGLVRQSVVPRSPTARPSPLRRTVTEHAVAVRDTNSGRLLTEVDAQVANTRFYPQRVFSLGLTRYQVPLGAHADRELRVEPVGADEPLTRPVLHVRAESPVLAEAVHEVQRGKLIYRLASYDAQIQESVSGVVRPPDTHIRYAPITSRYPGRVRAVFLPAPAAALFHLARSVDGALRGQLLCHDDDVEVVVLPPGFGDPGHSAGLLVVDRNVGGLGVAEALDLSVVASLLDQVRAILFSCKCTDGCSNCTPAEVLAAGPDKQGVLSVLGG